MAQDLLSLTLSQIYSSLTPSSLSQVFFQSELLVLSLRLFFCMSAGLVGETTHFSDYTSNHCDFSSENCEKSLS